MQQAAYYFTKENGDVQCNLCPHNCLIHQHQYGMCGVRSNVQGVLYAENYGLIAAAHIDPIEKKPLFDFEPHSRIFSIGSVGCNLRCSFCQNWEISQVRLANTHQHYFFYHPEEVLEQALFYIPKGNIGVAYTYNEPIIWFEYVRDCARLIKQKGLKNIMVSNGYINPEPLKELLPLIDAYNIDIKGFDDSFYKRLTGSKLPPVLNTLKAINEYGSHLEIAYLVIPGENDDEVEFEKMTNWLAVNLDKGFSLHINRYFPMYHLHIDSTPIDTLERLAAIARKVIPKVYIGNI